MELEIYYQFYANFCLKKTISFLSVVLEVGVHSYQNHIHRSRCNRGLCCDGSNTNPFEECTDFCDNVFVFCLGGAESDNCVETGVFEDNDDLTFTLGEPFHNTTSYNEVNNPVQLPIPHWTVSVTIHTCQ